MEQLVAELADLYGLAAAASVDEFPEAVLSTPRNEAWGRNHRPA